MKFPDAATPETAYLGIKSTILGGRVLRAKTPAGLTQAIYALLTTYRALRIAIDLLDTIGRHVLADLMPDRRLRVTPAWSNAPSPSSSPKATASAAPEATLGIDIHPPPDP